MPIPVVIGLSLLEAIEIIGSAASIAAFLWTINPDIYGEFSKKGLWGNWDDAWQDFLNEDLLIPAQAMLLQNSSTMPVMVAAYSHFMVREVLSARRDPLVLDLNGDGIRTTGIQGDVFTLFDDNSDAFAELTGWADPHDGMLAMDRNGNGIIDDGQELFGDQTILQNGRRAENGFEALAEFDSNKDGRIDVNDAVFSRLRVLTLNSTGDAYQLRTFDELGIRAINLDSTVTNITDAQGNTQNRVSSFEMADGTIREIAEYSFQQDSMYSVATEWLPVPDDIAALPDLQGYGTVYSLHQAMVRDTSGELRALVEEFASEMVRLSAA
ncbi:MAG: hypothetical protein HY912_19755 [Desulfomonile tiedjei]|uniref:Calcium-binding protein n=1 Tax=Desulfomonile tiedjei TaxID=2358 RepID=A0A9D6V571_9BACT|nr:hypothetical protein [Desulfomonile tiedjei]